MGEERNAEEKEENDGRRKGRHRRITNKRKRGKLEQRKTRETIWRE